MTEWSLIIYSCLMMDCSDGITQYRVDHIPTVEACSKLLIVSEKHHKRYVIGALCVEQYLGKKARKVKRKKEVQKI
jgi:hypothetical protein